MSSLPWKQNLGASNDRKPAVLLCRYYDQIDDCLNGGKSGSKLKSIYKSELSQSSKEARPRMFISSH